MNHEETKGVRNLRTLIRVSFIAICGIFLSANFVSAGSIDTEFIEQPWPKQWERHFEVGKWPVVWRQYASKEGGIFASIRFRAPLDQETVWNLTSDYKDIGEMIPGVSAVTYLEDTPNRQVIQMDVEVLWKQLRLVFEIERDPPNAVRFRMFNERLGEFRGVSKLESVMDDSGNSYTDMELATWLKTVKPVPAGLLLISQRMMLVEAARNFLDACEQYLTAAE